MNLPFYVSRNVRTLGYTGGGKGSRINLNHRGNRGIKTEKPATERGVAQEIAEREELSFPVQNCTSTGFITFFKTPGYSPRDGHITDGKHRNNPGFPGINLMEKG